MPKVTYIQANGATHVINVPVGLSVMEGAVSNGVVGIDADCGGACVCATCHVFVDCDWVARLVPPASGESEMLEMAAGARPESRLSCQISVTTALEGLIVHVPESQR